MLHRRIRRLGSPHRSCGVWALVAAACLLDGSDWPRAYGGGPADFSLRVTIGDRQLEGRPIWWDDQQMLLMARDGSLELFDHRTTRDAERASPSFVAYDADELRALLVEEFGKTYRVSTTQHFVVVHPPGAWNGWPERLESLYRRFVHAAQVRGFAIGPPPTLLAAIVFRSEADYFQHAAKSGTQLHPGTLGHYDPQSNRIYLFDAAGALTDGDAGGNQATILHEAAHQTAYNVGVHRRFAEQPRWLVEGLAMLFESPHAWNGTASGPAQRVHAQRLADFRQEQPARSADWPLRLVASDRSFDAAPVSAYAEAWALSFYLSETQPQAYARLLQRAAQRDVMSAYDATARVRDFAAEVESDWTMLAARIDRFLAELP